MNPARTRARSGPAPCPAAWRAPTSVRAPASASAACKANSHRACNASRHGARGGGQEDQSLTQVIRPRRPSVLRLHRRRFARFGCVSCRADRYSGSADQPNGRARSAPISYRRVHGIIVEITLAGKAMVKNHMRRVLRRSYSPRGLRRRRCGLFGRRRRRRWPSPAPAPTPVPPPPPPPPSATSIQVLPASFDFGKVTTNNSSAPLQVTISNTGTTPLTVSAITLSAPVRPTLCVGRRGRR